MYAHTLLLEKRITDIEANIRKTANMLADILDRRNIVALAWGETDSEIEDLDAWAIDLLDLLADLDSGLEHYSQMLDNVYAEVA